MRMKIYEQLVAFVRARFRLQLRLAVDLHEKPQHSGDAKARGSGETPQDHLPKNLNKVNLFNALQCSASASNKPFNVLICYCNWTVVSY